MPNSMNKLLYLALSLTICTNTAEALHNAHHIFNAIHSSMRQWGSSLNHNGVSFFRAQVPRGVQLHHGTSKPDHVEGIDWLAFEPEHAINFAVKLCDTDQDSLADDASSMSPRWWPQQAAVVSPQMSKPDQAFLSSPPVPAPLPPQCLEPGWLHTYTPTRDLELLYIDGTSAGNTACGTVDSQDFVLLWNKSRTYDPYDPLAERWRARGLCDLAQHEFEGKIDGFIRMEHGFEIILCDFSLLEAVSVLRSTKGAMNPGPTGRGVVDQFFFVRAITSRYSGIGGRRVLVDYDNFVTAFSHSEIDLWPDGNEQPRLNKISNATAAALLNEVKQMVLSNRLPVEERIDWQSVADMYVDRYARPIQTLTSPNFDSAKAVHKEMLRIFQPYLDRTLNESDATIKRCQKAYIPTYLVDSQHPSPGQQIIEQTMHDICSRLYMVLTERNGLDMQKHHLQTLMSALKWTAWKDCQPACAINEICFTAIWPLGTQEDHDSPSCLNATGISGRYGYWDPLS